MFLILNVISALEGTLQGLFLLIITVELGVLVVLVFTPFETAFQSISGRRLPGRGRNK